MDESRRVSVLVTIILISGTALDALTSARNDAELTNVGGVGRNRVRPLARHRVVDIDTCNCILGIALPASSCEKKYLKVRWESRWVAPLHAIRMAAITGTCQSFR